MSVLQTSALTKIFGGLTAVNRVDMHVEQNEIVALIGPNGAGKTTLFNAVTGVYPPTSGSVLLQGKEIAGTPPFKVTKMGVARTFQNIRLFSDMNALENVMIGTHCRTHTSVLGAIFHSRGAVREERGVIEKCEGLLEYVGSHNTVTRPHATYPTGHSGAWRLRVPRRRTLLSVPR